MAIRVTAPVRGFTGRINGDEFYRGVCDDASEANVAYYRRQGYTIGSADLPSMVIPEPEPDPEPVEQPEPVTAPESPKVTATGESPKRNAPRAVWAKFLTDQGITVEDGASRARMIDAWEQSQA